MKRGLSGRRTLALALMLAGLVCVGVAVFLNAGKGSPSDITSTWQLTLVGREGERKTLSYAEVKALNAYTGRGGFFTTTGVINGPYAAKGIPISDLCALVGGLIPSDLVKISAADGYSTMLDYDQIQGRFITYDPSNMKEKQHGDLKPILMYEEDGHPLSPGNGAPLRLAVAGQDGLLTEGLYWIKWINKVEVIKPRAAGDTG